MTCSRPERTATRQGLETGTPWSVVRDSNHYVSQPPDLVENPEDRFSCDTAIIMKRDEVGKTLHFMLFTSFIELLQPLI